MTERPKYLRAIDGAATQYRALFASMARGGRWHIHAGSAGYVLLQDGAQCDVPLPVVLRDVQGMTEATMRARLESDARARAFN